MGFSKNREDFCFGILGLFLVARAPFSVVSYCYRFSCRLASEQKKWKQ